MKRISLKKILLGVLSVLLLGGFLYLFLNFEAIVTRQAEKIASNAIGVNVDIDGMDISLKNRTVVISGITVANPKGYKKPYAVQTDTVTIALNTATRELIDFKDISVQGSVVTLEVNENGMNLVDLKNLANAKKKTETSEASEKVRVIIEKMVVESSVIEPHITFMDRDIASFSMPAVRFSNLGQGGGIHAGEAVTEILTKYLSAAERQARNSGALTGIKLPGMTEVEETINEAVEGIKGLFGR